MLVTTHYLDEAEHCHRIAIIHGGRLAALGSTDELKQIFHDRLILEIRTPRPVDAMRALEAMPGVDKTSVFGTAVHAVLQRHAGESQTAIRAQLERRGVTVQTIGAVPPSLEDVFLEVAGRREPAA